MKLIGSLDDAIRSLVLILPKMSGLVKTLKDKNSKLMFLFIDDDKLLEKYRIIWTNIEDNKEVW